MSKRLKATIVGLCAVAICAAQLRGQDRRPLAAIGGYLQWTSFDNSVGIDDFFASGLNLAVPVWRRLSVEGDLSRISTNGPPGTEVTVSSLRARAVYSVPIKPRIDGLIGVGIVRNQYGASREGSESGITAQLGSGFDIAPQLRFNLAFTVDHVSSPADPTRARGSTTTLGIRQGLSILIRRSRTGGTQ
ncbi:MAG: outer membrane beta-barrel protein [Gemmatimonadales bacterium]